MLTRRPAIEPTGNVGVRRVPVLLLLSRLRNRPDVLASCLAFSLVSQPSCTASRGVQHCCVGPMCSSQMNTSRPLSSQSRKQTEGVECRPRPRAAPCPIPTPRSGTAHTPHRHLPPTSRPHTRQCCHALRARVRLCPLRAASCGSAAAAVSSSRRGTLASRSGTRSSLARRRTCSRT